MKRLLALIVFFIAPVQAQLENILSPGRLPYLKESKLVQISSFDSTGGNNDFIAIPAGQSRTIASIDGPGAIVSIWVTIASKDPHVLRSLLLRMYWDDEKSPSVEAPIGDFFGTGFGYRQYVTPWLGMSSGGYFCYFPMPFNRHARIDVANESGFEVNSFYYHIDCQKLPQKLDSSIAYFHAQWRREARCERGKNYLVLDAEGEGHMVGMNMSMQSYENGMQYLEGDEMVFVDGELTPSIYGTGTEDYFTSGWYFNKGEFAAPSHGLIIKDDSLSRIAAYRFHITDAIPFRKSIRFTIEHGTENEERADYSSTAYWYQKEPHRPFPAIPGRGLRIPLRTAVPNGALEAESLTLRAVHSAGEVSSSINSRIEDMSTLGADWSGNHQLLISAAKPSERFAIDLPASESEYDVALYYTKGPAYGRLDIVSGGKKAGHIEGYNRAVVPGGSIVLKGLRASADRKLPLEFTITGKDAASSGFDAGLDAFVLTPRRSFIPEWYLIGPFANPRSERLERLGLDIRYQPETEAFDPARAYQGVGEKAVRWKLTKTPANGRMDLYEFDPYELVVIYALTHIYSPADQTLPLLLGSDDGVKVFLNDREIHRVLKIRVAEPDQDTVALSLHKGWNRLMLKVENNFGGYNFYARILDPDRTLTFSAERKRTR